MSDEFSVSVAGEMNIDESVLLARLKEALERGSKNVNLINGFAVDTDRDVQLLTGPVLGEIISTTAVILLEVKSLTSDEQV